MILFNRRHIVSRIYPIRTARYPVRSSVDETRETAAGMFFAAFDGEPYEPDFDRLAEVPRRCVGGID